MTKYHSLHCILPPDVLERVARTGDEQTRAAALDTMALDRRFRLSRAEAAASVAPFAVRTVTFARVGGQASRRRPGPNKWGYGAARPALTAKNPTVIRR